MARSESLLEFTDSDAREVASWATSIEEVRRWAGSAVGCPVDASVFRSWHADPDVRPYVMREGETLVGYGELWIDKQEVELARIIVGPTSRGRGVGRRLIRLLLERATRSGFPEAFVRVVPDNDVATACCRSAGFSSVPEPARKLYNRGQPVDYVWMRHPLRDPWGEGPVRSGTRLSWGHPGLPDLDPIAAAVPPVLEAAGVTTDDGVRVVLRETAPNPT